MGRKFKREWIYVYIYVTDSLCRTVETNMTLLSNYTPIKLILKAGNRIKSHPEGFPRGSAVKNLPANAGDTGSTPGPGRSHMWQSKKARVPQLLSPCSRHHALQQKKPLQ